MYTAIDFAKDTDIVVKGPHLAACKHKVVRPTRMKSLPRTRAA